MFSIAISALAQVGTPRLIDVHVHYNGEPGVLEKLLVKLNAIDGMAILLTTPQGLPEATRFIREHPNQCDILGPNIERPTIRGSANRDNFHENVKRNLDL